MARQIGSVYIKVEPDADGFRRRAQNDIRRQGPITAEGEVDLDRSQAMREKQQAERDMNRRPIKVDAEIDLDDRLRGIERAMQAFSQMSDDTRSMGKDVDRLSEQMRRMQRSMEDVKLGVNSEDFDRLEERIDELKAELELSTTSAEATFERFRTQLEAQGVGVDLEANPDMTSAAAANAAMRTAVRPIPVRTRVDRSSLLATLAQLQMVGSRPYSVEMRPVLRGWLAVEAQLLALSRDRVVRLRVDLGRRAWNTVRGGLRSMAGLGDMDEMIETFEKLTQQLDVYGTKIAAMGTIIGSAVNVIGHALGGALVTAADLSRAFGLIAAAPTAILAAWAGFHVHRTIWSGFGDALEGIPGALEELPPNAQRAVHAINDLSEAVNESVQDGFWGEMADEITRFTETVGPVLEENMNRTAQIYGDGLSRMLDLAQTWAESGQLGAAFKNINNMFEGIADGAVELVDAFVSVGMRASSLFPRLGHDFGQLMSGLNQWTQWAIEMGHIERWITQGVNVIHQLVRASGALGGIFAGLTQAARRAGIEGLPAFVRGLERARDVMQDPAWQVQMGNIFEGMAIGARDTWTGVERLAGAFMEAHWWARSLSIAIGEVAREGLFRLAEIIENPVFQRGSVDLFEGVRDSLITLEPAFQSIGTVLGELGTLVGEIIREMAPGINTLMGMFSDAATRLGPYLVAMVDPLTQFIDNMGHTVRHNLNTFVFPVLETLFGWFNSLPGQMQVFLSMLAVMTRWLPAFGNAVGRAATKLEAFHRANRAREAGAFGGPRYVAQIQAVDNALAGVATRFDRTAEASRRMSRVMATEARTAQTVFGRTLGAMRTGFASLGRAAERPLAGIANYAAGGAASMDRMNASLIAAQRNIRNLGEAQRRAMGSMGAGRYDRLMGFYDQRIVDSSRLTGPLNAQLTALQRVQQQAQRTGESLRRAFTLDGARANAERAISGVNTAIGRIGSGAQSGWSRMTANANLAFTGMQQSAERAAGRVNATLGTIGQRVFTRQGWSSTFLGLQSAAATAASSVATSMRTVATPAVQALGTAARGTAGLLRGMYGLIGGAPGLALVGLITSIGLVRQRAAEAEQAGERMFEAFREGDEAMLRSQVIDEMADSMTALSRAAHEVGANIDFSNMLDDLASGGDPEVWLKHADSLDQYARAWKQAEGTIGGIDAVMKKAEIGMDDVRAAAEAFGLSVEQVDKIMEQGDGLRFFGNNLFGDLLKDLNATSDALDLGQAKFAMWAAATDEAADALPATAAGARALADEMKRNGESFYEGSEGARQFSQAIAQIGADGANIEQQLSGMRTAMQMMGGEAYRQAEVAMEAWSHYEGAMMTANNMAQDSVMETGRVVGSSTDGIAKDFESMSERQNLAIQGTQQLHDLAMSRALDAYNEAINAGADHADAIEAGKEAYQSIDGAIEDFISSAKMSNEEAEIFRAEMQQLQDVDDLEVVLQLTNLADGEIEAAYDGLTKLNEAGLKIDQAEWMAFIAANPDQAYLAVSNLELVLMNFEANEWLATLDANDHNAVEALARIKGMGEEWNNGDYAAILGAILQTEDVDSAYELLVQWDQETAEAWLGANPDEAKQALQDIFDGMEGIDWEKTVEFHENGGETLQETIGNLAETIENLDRSIRIALGLDDPEDAETRIKDLVENLDLLNGQEARPFVELDDQATPEIDFLTQSVTDLDLRTASPHVSLNGLAEFMGGTDNARLALDNIPPHVASELRARGDIWSRAGDATEAIRGIPKSEVSTLTAQGDVWSRAHDAREAIVGIPKSETSTLNAAGDIWGRAGEAESSVRNIPESWHSTLDVRNQVVFIRLAEAAMRTVQAIPQQWQSRLMALDGISRVAANARRQILSIPNRTVRIRAVATGVGAAAAAIKSVRSANGNIFPSVKAFADGGFENHTAQIAKPSTTYRIWAEPETGGEAYIPLAASKRARSLAIWEETGRRLGAFEDGGVVGGDTGSTEGRVVINQTNYYPQQESNSRRLQRSLEFVSSGDETFAGV
ncbi:hypothetical protein Q7C18_02745 [Nesterenkonia sp. CL21]|uniref:hypothetical protein n=1 Tax=Nesterenkonia sp. CL21 TaxID=3064894 RepID=UPI002879E00E|nr:hypothetical protein [Nesterenkonia sp. CL21]MDS2171607.1 hypothetical protein [Nesterenkonia sp. CL21]